MARFSLSGVSKPLVAASGLPACHSSSDDRNSGANEWWEQAEREDEAVAQRWLEGWLAHRHTHAKLQKGSLVAIVLLMDCIAVPQLRNDSKKLCSGRYRPVWGGDG